MPKILKLLKNLPSIRRNQLINGCPNMSLGTKMDYKRFPKNTGENSMKKDSNSAKRYSDADLKPDKTCHIKNQDMGTMAKQTSLPGQMYVPKTTHNESDFAGEER